MKYVCNSFVNRKNAKNTLKYWSKFEIITNGCYITSPGQFTPCKTLVDGVLCHLAK